MLKVFVTFVLFTRAVLCYSQDSIPFYFDVTKFKVEEEFLVINPPYDTAKDALKVPADQRRTVTVLKDDSSLVRFVSRKLLVAGEPLYRGNSTIKRNYRFTWLRSFGKQIIVSLSKEKRAAKMETKWFTHNGIERTATKVLPLAKLKEFEALLSAMEFWQEGAVYIKRGIYIDGSNWFIEGKKARRYCMLYAYMPAVESPIRKLGEWLIASSDASGEKIY